MSLIVDIVERFNTLESDRAIWNDIFEDIRTYIYPTTASFVSSNPGDNGFDRNRKIFDPTAERAHSDLVGALMSGLTNPASKWFELSLVNQRLMEIDSVRRHLETATNQILAIFSNPDSNFYAAMHEGYFEITGLGTTVIFKRGKGINSFFQTIPIADVYFEENDFGRVDTVYRPIYMTPKQVLDQFPTIDDDVRTYVESNLRNVPSQRLKVIHTIRPRKKRSPKKIDKLNKKYESVYILADNNMLLEEDGFDKFPFYVMRWEKIAGREVMGRAPAMKALKDAKVLNKMEKTNLRAGELVVEPPLQAPHGAFVRRLNLSSQQVNFYKAIPGLPDPTARPLLTTGNLPVGLEMANQKRRAIQESFFIDLIAETKRGEMTQMEVSQREQDRLGRMAPQLARIQAEGLSRIVNDLYNEILEDELIDNPPIEMTTEDVKPVYNSPLARAQRQSNVIGLQRFLNTLSAVGQIYPEVLLVPKPLELVEELRALEGVSSRILRTEEEVQAEQERLQQQQQQQAAVEQARTLTEAGRNVADIQQKGGDLNAIFS